MRRLLALLRPMRHLVPPLLLVAFVWILVARACGGGPQTDPDARPRVVEARGDLAADERSTVELFERASPAVVHVANLVVVRRSRVSDPMEVPRGTGTGFVWDPRGYVVTNQHVVDGGDDFAVSFADGAQFRATLVGEAPSYDLAVLKIDPGEAKLAALPVGTSADLRVGQKVFAIGNPFGLDQTLTSGIVSGLGREIVSPGGRPIYDVIQTDAAINPGNSGGPLLDSAGRVIGVNTQIASPSGASAGIGFSIPVDTVNRIVPELIRRGGSFVRPVLGVVVAPEFDPRAAETRGAVIDSVTRGTGAAAAGLRPSDVIVRVAATPVRNRIDLFRALDRHSPGERVPVTVRRGGEEQVVEVVLSGAEDAVRR
jgi:S1-C subfamily serine protease